MKRILFTVLILCVTSCAHPVIETQTIPVFSEPQGAEVSVNGIVVGTTPISIPLEKNRDHMITVTKLGFKPEAVPIERKLRPENLVVTGLLRMHSITSKSFFNAPLREAQESNETGKNYQLVPQIVSICLQPSASGITENKKNVVLIEEMSHLG
jgi:hypothetical protein